VFFQPGHADIGEQAEELVPLAPELNGVAIVAIFRFRAVPDFRELPDK
jgi:hypothetical protein